MGSVATEIEREMSRYAMSILKAAMDFSRVKMAEGPLLFKGDA